MPISEVYNEDNMIGMARYPDKFFDLAIIDPPYGIGEDGKSNHSRGGPFGGKRNYGNKNTRKTIIPSKKYSAKGWDKAAPNSEYFDELIRVSMFQIIWGANHFISRLPYDSPCWIVWDKDNGDSDFADCELAWTSFKKAVRKFKWKWSGMLQEKMSEKEERIHPTQKPVALYKWLLHRFAEPGNKILDTHMGSQSSRIAAYQMGFDYFGWEIDKDYFEAGNKRFKEQTAQLKLL